MKLNEEKELTIEEFFNLCEKEEGTYQIDTPDGWQDINFLVRKKDKECYNLVLEDGSELGCSDEHLVLTDDGWKSAENFDINKDVIHTKNGKKNVVAKEYIGIRNTFDMSVNSKEHRYYSNNIISHNCGKSLVAKAIASYYQMPLIRLDIGSVFSGTVGSSERKMREALKTIDSVNKTVVLIDEVEKGLSGGRSSGYTDGGTTSRVIGTILTWMQERKGMSFIVATSNNINDIPPEFMRAGRFDEVFYFDLPNKNERADIAGKLLRRKGRDYEKFDLQAIAEYCENYVGAEIEKAIDNALYLCYYEDKRELMTEDICKAFKEFIPLYISRKDDIQAMRTWAKNGGAIFANSSTTLSPTKKLKPPKVNKEIELDFGRELEI